jgi:hypothetical protein
MTSSDSATHQNADRQAAERRRRAPVVQEAGPQTQSPELLQRAVTNPAAARPVDILALQRHYGNQAVQRLLAEAGAQAKLTVGPAGDRYEQEADRVADQVMAAPRPAVQRAKEEDEEEVQAKPLAGVITPLVQRAREEDEEEVQAKPLAGTITPLVQRVAEIEEALPAKQQDPRGSFDAGAAIEDQLHTQSGGGSPLPAEVQSYMEPRFGADLSGVRVHTGSQACQLNQQLSAQAFTHGQDIYLGEGRYSPGSTEGQRLLAHELTHVVQQGAAKRGVSIAPARVQRLAKRADLEHLAGGLGFFEKWGKGTYKKLLEALEQYQADKKPETLNLALRLATAWVTEHETAKLGDVDKRRALFVPGLIKEIQTALGTQADGRETTPTEYKQRETEGQEKGEAGLKAINKDKESFTKEKEDPNVQYIFEVKAAIDLPEYLEFAKKRTQLTLESKRKFWQKKSSKDIKQEAARAVLESKPEYQQATEQKKDELLRRLMEAGGAVGHTWVKFRIMTQGKVTDDKSFGFWPLAYYASPTGSVPGRVKHPDASDGHHPQEMAKDYKIGHKQYLDGLMRAYQVLKNPPSYKLIDYNCTKFALDVASAAGVSFPENAFMRVPVAATLGLTSTKAYNPNALYEALNQDPTAVDPKKQAEQEKKAREEQLARLGSITLTPYTDVDGDAGIPLRADQVTAKDISLADDEYQTHGPDWLEIVVMLYTGAEQFVVKRAEYETFMQALRGRTQI